jgi:hypothetical protein
VIFRATIPAATALLFRVGNVAIEVDGRQRRRSVMAQNMNPPNQGNQGNNPSQGNNPGSTTTKKPGHETTVKSGEHTPSDKK